MIVKQFREGSELPEAPLETDITRIEVEMTDDAGRRYTLIMLDADDTFDVIAQNPQGDRVTLWSRPKPVEGADEL